MNQTQINQLTARILEAENQQTELKLQFEMDFNEMERNLTIKNDEIKNLKEKVKLIVCILKLIKY